MKSKGEWQRIPGEARLVLVAEGAPIAGAVSYSQGNWYWGTSIANEHSKSSSKEAAQRDAEKALRRIALMILNALGGAPKKEGK